MAQPVSLGNPHLMDVVSTPLLDATQCDRVLARVEEDLWKPATVTDLQRPEVVGPSLADDSSSIAPRIRSVSEQPVVIDSLGWPVSQILASVNHWNRECFRFDLRGVYSDSPMVLRYRAQTGDHYGPHLDIGAPISTRKLSFVVQLSDPADYDGGELHFPVSNRSADRSRGTMTLFPSFLWHQLTPLTRGTRYAVVGWIHGETFR